MKIIFEREVQTSIKKYEIGKKYDISTAEYTRVGMFADILAMETAGLDTTRAKGLK